MTFEEACSLIWNTSKDVLRWCFNFCCAVVRCCKDALLHLCYRCPYCEDNVLWIVVCAASSIYSRVSDFFSLEGVFLIKRCDQETTRTVENSIINQSNLRRHKLQDWSTNLDDQNPVVVFCVISSRIGTDIDSAMRGAITNGNSVILVLLHFQNKSQLRGDLSDNEYLLDDKTKDRFVGIAHFAFSEQENLYSCAQNTQGIKKLNELILTARSP